MHGDPRLFQDVPRSRNNVIQNSDLANFGVSGRSDRFLVISIGWGYGWGYGLAIPPMLTTLKIKSAPPFASVPILMITGYSGKKVVERSVKAGASGFVVKPFSREVLLAKIRSVLKDPENGAPNDCGPVAS